MGSRTREAGSARTIEATLTEGRCACCAWADGDHSRGPAAMIAPAATVTTTSPHRATRPGTRVARTTRATCTADARARSLDQCSGPPDSIPLPNGPGSTPFMLGGARDQVGYGRRCPVDHLLRRRKARPAGDDARQVHFLPVRLVGRPLELLEAIEQVLDE